MDNYVMVFAFACHCFICALAVRSVANSPFKKQEEKGFGLRKFLMRFMMMRIYYGMTDSKLRDRRIAEGRNNPFAGLFNGED